MNEKIVTYSELVTAGQKPLMTYFKELPNHSPGRAQENHKRSQSQQLMPQLRLKLGSS